PAPPRARLSPHALHDALPISAEAGSRWAAEAGPRKLGRGGRAALGRGGRAAGRAPKRGCCAAVDACYRWIVAPVFPRLMCMRRRSEEHTSELQSRENLVCRLL